MGAFLGRGLYCDRHKDTALTAAATASIVAAMPYFPVTVLSTVAVLSVAGQFGIQLYTTFVAGPTMIFNMERQAFSDIQSKLFPKFGLFGVSTSALALAAFLVLSTYSTSSSSSLTAELSSLLSSKLGLLLLAPLLFSVAQVAVIFPTNIRLLEEIKNEKSEEKKKEKRKKFGAAHGVSMIVNLLTMIFNAAITYQVSKSVSFSPQ